MSLISTDRHGVIRQKAIFTSDETALFWVITQRGVVRAVLGYFAAED